MKMSEVQVGMRLRSIYPPYDEVTVTELTERGFKYAFDSAQPFIPRWGLTIAQDGHEHFGFNGEAGFEPVQNDLDPCPKL